MLAAFPRSIPVGDAEHLSDELGDASGRPYRNANLFAGYHLDERVDDHGTWGHAGTNPLLALRVTDLTSAEADLIEQFVPHAVGEAGGCAGFRKTATKTNSLVDRLRALTLPRPADVREGLASYIETRERAAELDERISRTDDLIDEIVYDLYGLSDEERAVVEDAGGD